MLNNCQDYLTNSLRSTPYKQLPRLSNKFTTFYTINIMSNNFHCRFHIHLMHACRLKAGFPTIFEIVSAKSEGRVKYICV